MSGTKSAVAVAAAIVSLAAAELNAQEPAPNPILKSVQDGAKHLERMFLTAAEQMSDEDYLFRPTPQVRSFAELLGHVADTNFWFCSVAAGQTPPSTSVEKTTTDRVALQNALRESFDFCNDVYASIARAENATRVVELMGEQRQALSVLNFRIYHGMLHWGNAITYMRLRGKVPPTA